MTRPPVGLKRLAVGAHHFLAGGFFGAVGGLGEGAARDGERVTVQIAALDQALGDQLNAAGA